MQSPRCLRLIVGLLLLAAIVPARAAYDLFAPTNLVAWCVVPFDAKKRGPEERAAMLQRLGVSRLAYDWRAEHIPTFDAEVAALAKRKIELRAWWFPAELNAEARAILDTLRRHKLSPELWVMLVDPAPNGDPAAKVEAAAQQLQPIAEAAREIGSKIGLYNHGGWFGEPENQLRVKARLAELGCANVGLVYNLHHGHAHFDRLPALFRAIAPHLLCLNLNGMVRNGDQVGKKIVPFGDGDDDLAILRAVRESGYRGPIGVLGHTDEDVAVKLGKDLSGLRQVATRLAMDTKAAAGIPKISGREADQQSEADWVDNRWQQTDVGPFLASNLPLPEGTIAKGLSIKVGENDAGTVAYDTANGALRAAWTGGFLQFNPGRFGLIGAPKPAAPLAFSPKPDPAWPGHTYRFVGLHRAAEGTVLEATVDGVRVLEKPSLETSLVGSVFVRTFWVDAHPRPLKLLAAAHLKGGSHNQEKQEARRNDRVTRSRVTVSSRQEGTSFAASTDAVVGETSVRGGDDGGVFEITLPPSKTARSFSVRLWRGTQTEFSKFRDWANAAEAAKSPKDQLKPAKPMWPELKTVGSRGADTDFLAVDTLTLPYDNPWNALMLAAGVDFGPKGEGYLCTIHGDVWQVTGIDGTLKDLRWKRYATGLFQALGLKVVDGKVLVLGRDRITRLHDENGDGEADFYESFFDGIATSTGGHDYVTCLETDAAGNLYYVDPKGVHRVSPDGKSQTTLATGWRNPNGMGVSPAGLVTVAPQQGEWTPSSQISEVRAGGYYGFGGPRVSDARPLGYDLPLCWIPHRVDNASGSQVWIPQGRTAFQPVPSGTSTRLDDSLLAGQMLHLLWGRCGMMLVLRDASGPVPQGAVVPLPGKFLSGPNRASFNSRDGALYVAGSTGWQTSAARDGALQRVRWTGKTPLMPVAWQARSDGLSLTFSQPLDRATAEDAGSYGVKRWNYLYARQYGSKDWSVANPDQEGRDDVPVKSAKLQPDGRTVVLDLGPMTPAMQMEVQWNLDTAAGQFIQSQLWMTVNAVP